MYQLAVKLGRANVDALARSLTAKQFAAWEHYAALEPFQEIRQDYRIASIVAMLANVNRSAKTPPYKLKDFLLFEEQEAPKPELTRMTQISMIRAIATAYDAVEKK